MVNEVKEEPNIPDSPSPVTSFYLSLNIQVPTGGDTRSTTENTDPSDSSDGTLPAAANENIIESAQLYFFNADDPHEQLCKIMAYKKPTIVGKDNEWTVTAKVEPDELRELMGKTVNLYVFANPYNYYYQSSDRKEAGFQGSSFDISGLNGRPVQPFGEGEDGQLCPMANRDMFTIDAFKEMPKDVKSDREILAAVSSIFNKEYTAPDGTEGMLWNVENSEQKTQLILERQIARVDYKDGSTIAGKPFLYKLPDAKYYKEDGTEEEVYLKIMSMQLFNIDKEAYTMRHTQRISSDGAESNLTIFGREKDNSNDQDYNWMADYNWLNKKSGIFNGYNPYRTLSGTDALISSEDLERWEDKYFHTSGNEYVPWHYLMENTLPSTDKMTLDLATGVVFNVALCNANGSPIEGEEDTFKRIIMSNGKYQDVRYKREVTKQVTIFEGDEEVSELKEISPAGYYLTYNYLIEHNRETGNTVNGSTGTQSTIAPMQIGIVRNNVYQLSVTDIKNLPNPEDPEDLTIEIKIQVLPWGLRVDDNVILK